MVCTIDLDELSSYPVFTSLFALFHVQLGHLFHTLGSIKSNIPRPLVSHMTLRGWQRRIKLQLNLKTSTKKNQDDLSAFRSKPLIRRRKKDAPPAANQIVICPLSRWVWSNVGKSLPPFAGSCILSLLHAAINSSSIRAGDCSHFPPMPLQPSLHDNRDLKHQAGERYDMWAAC